MSGYSHTDADADAAPLPLETSKYAMWGKTTGQDGCEKSRLTPVLCPQTVQHGTSCISNYGFMNHLEVIPVAVFIVDAFSVSNIFLCLRIAHRSIF